MDVPPSQPQIPAIPGKKRKFFCNFFGGEFLEKNFFMGEIPEKKKILLDFFGGISWEKQNFFFSRNSQKKETPKNSVQFFWELFFSTTLLPQSHFYFLFSRWIDGNFPIFPSGMGIFPGGIRPPHLTEDFPGFPVAVDLPFPDVFLLFSPRFSRFFPIFPLFFPPPPLGAFGAVVSVVKRENSRGFCGF